MVPAKQGYPVHRDVLGPLADYLNGRRIPILLNIKDIVPTYENLLEFCRIFNKCPVVIGEVRWANYWRLISSVMDACPNAFLEFHKFQGNRALEVFSERYGIERMMFGSGLLRCSAGAARVVLWIFLFLRGKKWRSLRVKTLQICLINLLIRLSRKLNPLI
jgi:hypothetical protein